VKEQQRQQQSVCLIFAISGHLGSHLLTMDMLTFCHSKIFSCCETNSFSLSSNPGCLFLQGIPTISPFLTLMPDFFILFEEEEA